MPVYEMLRRMSSYEIEEWKAYLTLEADEQKKRELARRAEEGLRNRPPRRKGR